MLYNESNIWAISPCEISIVFFNFSRELVMHIMINAG